VFPPSRISLTPTGAARHDALRSALAVEGPARLETGRGDEQDGGMGRFDVRVLLVVPLLALGGCGSDDKSERPAPPAAASSATPGPSASAGPSASSSVSTGPAPDESVYVEQDDDPTAAPGDLSDKGQAYLDEAIGTELAALEASGDKGKQRRQALEKLPEDPSKVLVALRTYSWWSPEAKTLYDKAVATTK
jgi:hypothetical protein